jgi:mevalonate kinase
MTALRLSLPGKTFLAGEYLALSGGPALLAAVEPRFELVVEKNNSKGENPFHADSPAGQLWLRHQSYLQDFSLAFIDPHQRQGGFGGSTAEFALLHMFVQLKDSLWVGAQANFDLHGMLNDYRATCAGRASGADLIGQVRGGITLFVRERGQIQNYPWLFSDIGFFLAKTGRKLKTHEHLLNLSAFPTEGFANAMKAVEKSFLDFNSDIFIDGINAYAGELKKCGFVAEHTGQLLSGLSHPDILAKKGCGAMGADVIAVFYRHSDRQMEVLENLDKLGLQVVATESSLSTGIAWKLGKAQTLEVQA